MAECRSCGKEIPEGNLYCSECEARMKADESYLDSLLSSVVSSSAEPVQERPVKKTTAEPVSPTFAMREEPLPIEEVVGYEPETIPELDELEELYEVAEEEDLLPVTESLRDNYVADTFEEVAAFTETEDAVDEEAPETIGHSADVSAYDIFKETDDSFLDDLFADSQEDEYAESPEEELLDDLLRTVDDAQDESGYELDLESLREDAASFSFEEKSGSELQNFGSYDDELDEEAALLGEALAEEVFSVQDEYAEEPEDISQAMQAEDEFFDMNDFSQFADPVQEIEEISTESATVESSDDIMDFWNMMNMDEVDIAEEHITEDTFGEFPSLLEGTDELEVPEIGTAPQVTAQDEKPKKKNIFQRLFGNIREDLTPEEIEERKRIALEKFEEDEQRAADEAAKAKLNKEEKAKRKEEEAELKKQEQEQLARKKREAKLEKEEQKRIQRDKKEQARRALLAEIEANEGKINKFGASIIFVMFAVVLCFIVLGTGYYNYKLSIEKAQFDFDLQRYDDAYNDVYGLDIKEEDMELYDKIMTVQYVNIQLLSYMRYNSLDMDAEALDSLIKGLRRYEKFIQYGAEIGVVKDLDYLKKQILQQLDEVFGVDEATAYAMLELENQGEYSVQIYEIVSQRN